MVKKIFKFCLGFGILFLFNSCTPGLLLCFLEFNEFNKTYVFNYSKEELKTKIVEAYTYDRSLFLKNFGLTLIENESINNEYRKSLDVWLDKTNWDEFKSEISNNTPDTLNLLICKHHGRKEISLTAIISGNSKHSTLTLMNVKFQKRRICNKEREFYLTRITKKIDKRFIDKL